MSKVEFKVSAKAARLIGRENISDSDGALIELIKNAYDADATFVYLKLNIPFCSIPRETSLVYLKQFLNDDEMDFILNQYDVVNGKCILKSNLSLDIRETMEKFLFSKNSITICDNGCGMSVNVVEDIWMQIGTNDKESNSRSPKGRIKTGAKGIGRFALDKLSLESKMFSKSQNEDLVTWQIDWEQFSNTKLLNQIHADISLEENNYSENLISIFEEEDLDLLTKHNWETGTCIILNPLRESWSERIFKKINRNLSSIIPLSSADKFDIYVHNVIYPEYSFNSVDNNAGKVDYDYRIMGNFDGKDTLKVKLSRNEIDTTMDNVTLVIDNEQHCYQLDDFWDRDAFNKPNHNRGSYSKNVEFSLVLSSEESISDADIEQLADLGRFDFDLYFIKNGKSDLEIVKNVNISRRKSFLKNFSGIKLYRDDFKVRPYGDTDSSLFDWLNLGNRAQRSPAAVTHLNGKWQVEPYQMIGSVHLGRFENPMLTDMANREGLVSNSYYELLVELITTAIKRFEFDRQYILREYYLWRKDKIEQLSDTSFLVNEIINKENIKSFHDLKEDSYTKDDYKEAVKELVRGKQDNLKTMQILMAFSSAGVLTNTFSHEISRIATGMGSRMQHLRASINLILDYQEYTGDEDFNPYEMITGVEETDILIESWIRVIMESVDPNSFTDDIQDLRELTNKIISLWKPLLSKKYIIVESKFLSSDSQFLFSMQGIDFHLILNNFILNSAWFLESAEYVERIIYIDLIKTNEEIEIQLRNNGPILEQNYKNNPDMIFEAGETSKKDGKGTGLGLWILREVVNRYSGNVSVIDLESGFGIKIIIPI